MNRIPRLLLVLAAAAASAAAQSEAPTPTPAPVQESTDASGIVLAAKAQNYVPAPPKDSDGVSRTVSPGIAQALADGMPKFSPPTPTPAEVATQDLRDVDKPKNEIPRLPKYVVHESRPPVFRDRDLYTPEGLISLSFRSHPGLAIGNILGLNEGPAREMWLDDQRLSSISDLDDTAHAMAQGGDKAEANYILQETQDTFMRSDFTNFGGPVPSGGLSGGGGK